jgi:cytochrome oxidase assembly protein ShyY1
LLVSRGFFRFSGKEKAARRKRLIQDLQLQGLTETTNNMKNKSKQPESQLNCLNCGCRVPETDGFYQLFYCSKNGKFQTLEICDGCSLKDRQRTLALVSSVFAQVNAAKGGAK